MMTQLCLQRRHDVCFTADCECICHTVKRGGPKRKGPKGRPDPDKPNPAAEREPEKVRCDA